MKIVIRVRAAQTIGPRKATWMNICRVPASAFGYRRFFERANGLSGLIAFLDDFFDALIH